MHRTPCVPPSQIIHQSQAVYLGKKSQAEKAKLLQLVAKPWSPFPLDLQIASFHCSFQNANLKLHLIGSDLSDTRRNVFPRRQNTGGNSAGSDPVKKPAPGGGSVGALPRRGGAAAGGSRQAVVRCPAETTACRCPACPQATPPRIPAPRAGRRAARGTTCSRPNRNRTQPNAAAPSARRALVSSPRRGAARHGSHAVAGSPLVWGRPRWAPRQGRHRQGGQSGREGRQTPSAKATRAKARGATATRRLG